MKLFYAAPSPFARKARIVAREHDLMDRIEEISVNPYQDDERLLATNPAGLVPALALDDGSNLIDSPVICQYLDSIADAPSLIPTESNAHWRTLHHAALGDVIMDFAVAAVVEQRRTDTPPSQAFVERKLKRIVSCLSSLPANTDSEYLTLGNITSACALTYLDFRLPELEWRATRPDLAPWIDTIESRPAFRATQPAEHTA